MSKYGFARSLTYLLVFAGAPEEWLEALAPLGTDDQKPSLEVAPWLIAVF